MADFRPPAFLSPLPFTPSSMMSLTMPPVSPALSNFSNRGMGSGDWGMDSISIPDSAGGSGTSTSREDRRHAPREDKDKDRSSTKGNGNANANANGNGNGNGNGAKHKQSSPRGLKAGLSADSGYGHGQEQEQARADGASVEYGEAGADRVPTTPALIMSSLSSPRSSSAGGGLESNSLSLDSTEGSWGLEDGDGDGDGEFGVSSSTMGQ